MKLTQIFTKTIEFFVLKSPLPMITMYDTNVTATFILQSLGKLLKSRQYITLGFQK